MNATVVCALGYGEFQPRHVVRLVAQVHRHSPGTRIACLTKRGGEIEHLVDEIWPLQDYEQAWWQWWGNWPKLAMFKRKGPCLFLDLDVTVVGDLSMLLRLASTGEGVVACRDFWNCNPPQCNSSVVAWNGGEQQIYNSFADDPNGMRMGARHKWSDQDHIMVYASRWQAWQDLLPGSVRSFKRDLAFKEAVPHGLVVAVSHGQPRPWAPGGADQWFAGKGVVV